MKHRVIGVLIGVGAGILISYALYARAEVITYTAPELIEEPKEVVVEIETEGQKIERLVREEFEDAPVMIEVARCESEFKNVPGKLSDDFGPFQINYVHLGTLEELGLDRTKVEDNIRFARKLYDEQGLQPWNSSRDCWNK